MHFKSHGQEPNNNVRNEEFTDEISQQTIQNICRGANIKTQLEKQHKQEQILQLEGSGSHPTESIINTKYSIQNEDNKWLWLDLQVINAWTNQICDSVVFQPAFQDMTYAEEKLKCASKCWVEGFFFNVC